MEEWLKQLIYERITVSPDIELYPEQIAEVLAFDILESLQEQGWTPPMSEASAAAHAEGEFWRHMEGQYREAVHEPDV